MVFLGFILVAVAAAVSAGVVLDNTDAAQLVLFGQTVPGLSSEWQVFLAGAGTAVVFVLGMTLTVTGIARRIRNRRDLRDLREEHEESLTTLEMEKRRLERELARARQGSARQGAKTEPAAAPVQGVRVAPRSRVPAASPFFERNE